LYVSQLYGQHPQPQKISTQTEEMFASSAEVMLTGTDGCTQVDEMEVSHGLIRITIAFVWTVTYSVITSVISGGVVSSRISELSIWIGNVARARNTTYLLFDAIILMIINYQGRDRFFFLTVSATG
jgi:hypothetical protein